jgi:hypothetical protein
LVELFIIHTNSILRPKYKYCLFPLDLPTHSNGPYPHILLDMKFILFPIVICLWICLFSTIKSICSVLGTLCIVCKCTLWYILNNIQQFPYLHVPTQVATEWVCQGETTHIVSLASYQICQTKDTF